jgi:hypothetical protein
MGSLQRVKNAADAYCQAQSLPYAVAAILACISTGVFLFLWIMEKRLTTRLVARALKEFSHISFKDQ